MDMNASNTAGGSSHQCSASLVEKPMSALALLRQTRRRPRLFLLNSPSYGGVYELDLGITEIAGAAGSGKTQLCLGLCCACACEQRQEGNYGSLGNQKENTNPSRRFHRALYVSMGEGGSTAKIAERLSTIAQHRRKQGSHAPVGEMLSRVLTISVRNEDEFLNLVNEDLPNLLSESTESPVGVVLFDSIAGLFRVPDTGSSSGSFFSRRSGVLFDVAAKLKRLSHQFEAPMVVVNQVTSIISDSSQNQVVPALGVTWSNCVNTSFLVTREESWVNVEVQKDQQSLATEKQSKCSRKIILKRSSRLPMSLVEFEVGSGGPVATE